MEADEVVATLRALVDGCDYEDWTNAARSVAAYEDNTFFVEKDGERFLVTVAKVSE